MRYCHRQRTKKSHLGFEKNPCFIRSTHIAWLLCKTTFSHNNNHKNRSIIVRIITKFIQCKLRLQFLPGTISTAHLTFVKRLKNLLGTQLFFWKFEINQDVQFSFVEIIVANAMYNSCRPVDIWFKIHDIIHFYTSFRVMSAGRI